jgi:hypothetical protein
MAGNSALSPVSSSQPQQDWSWPFWYLVPIYPYGQKRTLRQEIVPDWIWTFEQLQGIFYVVVPIRMTVVRLKDGGLLVYAPVAPTRECRGLLQELIDRYGDVKYIILPTISGLEHKVFVGPFARHFPQALVYTAPGQWSFPLNLPLTWLGFPPRRTQGLPSDPSQTPFFAEFDYRILGPLDLRLGQFGEVAFFHRPTQTLLVTDSLISIPEEPPTILQLDPYPLLFHAKDSGPAPLVDTPDQRQKGWQRICLFALYFQASTLQVPNWGQVFREASQAPERRAKNYFGLYPFQWKTHWLETFQRLRAEGQLRVAPILRELILNRYPQTTLAWVEQISQWPVARLIPCHFAAPLTVTPADIRQAFAFLEQQLSVDKQRLVQDPWPLPEEDLQTLRRIDHWLTRYRITPDRYRASSPTLGKT